MMEEKPVKPGRGDRKQKPGPLIEEWNGSSYEYIRKAKRDKFAAGANVYAKCPNCGEFVRLMPGSSPCSCGGIIIQSAPGNHLIAGGSGREPLAIYRGQYMMPGSGGGGMTDKELMREAAKQVLHEAVKRPVEDTKAKAAAKKPGSIWKT